MASNRSRSNRSVGNKLNNLDSRVSRNEKGTNNPHLSPDVIEEAHLTDAAVSEGKIAERAVTENKIARGAIGTEHLGIVNTVTADSGLTLKPGPDGGFIVIDGPEYVAPAAGSGDLYALAFNELNQVVVSTTGVGGGDGIAAMPAGSIQPWPSDTAPEGWLMCDGSAVSRSTYSALFDVLCPAANANLTLRVLQASAIGSGYFYFFESGSVYSGKTFQLSDTLGLSGFSPYSSYYFDYVYTGPTYGWKYRLAYVGGVPSASAGANNFSYTLPVGRYSSFGLGNGSSTFNVPDIRGRTVVGVATADTDFATLAKIGGAKTHTLTASQIPAHTHGFSGTTTTTGSSHRHWISAAAIDDRNFTGTGANSQDYGVVSDAGSWSINDGDSGAGSYSSYTGSEHTHTYSGTTDNGTGGGQAHNILQPYIALNYIIKHMVADGMQGPQGIQGEPGDAATVAVGSTTTGSPGSVATVTNAGTSSAAVLNFTIPRGDTGAQGVPGAQGPSGTVTVGSTSTGVEGTDAQVTNSGTSTNAILEFVIPRGNSATIAVGTTTTGAPGTPATVTNVGDNHAAIFDFVVPEGIGATVDVGTVTTGTEDDTVTVTNSGTNVDAIFNFDIPQGKTGDSAGVQYAFSTTTTDADPGVGIIRANNSTPASITYLYFDNVDAGGSSRTAWYDQWDTSNSVIKGQIYVGTYRSNAVAIFNITGAVEVATGYYKIPVAYVSGNLPADTNVCYVAMAAAGNIGNETPPGGTDGQILSKASNADYDFEWVDNTPYLSSLLDVSLTTPITGGQALTYDDATDKWINATPATTLDSLTDVGLTEPITDGQALTFVEGSTRTNLVSNPNFEVDTTGWSGGYGITLTRTTSEHYVGTASLSCDFYSFGTAASSAISMPTDSGVSYTASAYVKGAAGFQISMGLYSGSGWTLEGTTGAVTMTGDWIRVSVTAVSPFDSNSLFIKFDKQSVTDPPILYVDAVLVEQSTSAGDYFDGSSTGASWTGTAHASTSTLVTAGSWTNATPASDLDSLTDVDISTVPAVDGDILTYDAVAAQWTAQSLGNAAMPAGSVMAWGGDTAPAGWLLCNGAEVSRSTYASLFTAIGTAFGAGDTVMTFNLPDLRGRTPFGRDAGQTEFDILGETGGSKTTSFPTQGDGTSTGNGLAYSSSMSSVDDGTYNNLPPYQTLNYIIKWASGETPTDESQLTDRVSDLEEIVQTAYNQMPAGAIMAWSSDVAPSNWLMCDGSAVSRTLYASLYATIGDSYGAGDGSTTFNLPDLRGRVPVGKSGSDTAFNTLGEAGGRSTLPGDGLGTKTGLGLMYGSSMDQTTTSQSNMPPYQTVNYVIKATAGTTESDSALTDRVSTLESTVGSMFPAGTILASALATAPAGWAICDGSAVSRSTYASLFAAIGTTYGVGDNVTTFNLPNLKGRTIFGKDSAQTEFDTLGETGGNKLIQGHGSGTATGYGLTYSESVLTATGLTTAQNLPPYTALNYLIRLNTATPDAESEFVTRLGELETFVENGGNESPAGSIMAWGALTAPTNWLLCDGSVVLKADWPSLYAAIGNQYATGGETELQFRLPNLKGRVAVGRDSAQTEFDTLGETGGAKTHTLTEAEMPSHTHIQNAHTHIQDSHNHTQDPHTHQAPTWNGTSGSWEVATGGYNYDYPGGPNVTTTTATNQATTATNQNTTATNQNSGGGAAHNNLQPYIVLNYIIKATAGVSTTDSTIVERVGQLELDAEAPIKLNLQTISADYTIPVGYNGLSAGPIIIASGVTVTIPDGSAWSVV